MGEQPKKDWSYADKIYKEVQGKEKGKTEIPSASEDILSGRPVERVSGEDQVKLKTQLENEKKLNDQRLAEDLRKAHEEFEEKWGK